MRIFGEQGTKWMIALCISSTYAETKQIALMAIGESGYGLIGEEPM
jgi:hypothetical protein